MKYYFFRDRAHQADFDCGVAFEAVGLIESIHCPIGETLPSGKEICVLYVNPINGEIDREWREWEEVNVYKVESWEYDYLKQKLLSMEG